LDLSSVYDPTGGDPRRPGLIGQPITLFLRRVRGADRDGEWQLPGDALAERIDAILSALRPTIDP
jgi:hypothetical protein